MSKPTNASDLPTIVSLSPASRAAWIIGGFFLALIGGAAIWITHEAQRIIHLRQATQIVNLRNGETSDMVWIPSGTFTMGGIGTEIPADELPLHDVKIDGFWIDRTTVTNEEFARFVAATGYVTVAEKPVTSKTIPGLLPQFEGQACSLCFRKPGPEEKVDNAYQWWEPRVGADWRHPEGAGLSIAGREKHPVVQVCYQDAIAYCKWAGKRLPTESEWEYAARGGLNAQPYVWGSEFRPGGRWMANTWQGHFPDEERVEDGFAGTSPVGSFPANGFGLYDMAGNVWQMTEDWYRPDTYAMLAKNGDREARHNPKGPSDSYDPDEPGVWKKVVRGGSFMCSDNYCRGYRPSARMKIAPDTGLQNTGFRCVKDSFP